MVHDLTEISPGQRAKLVGFGDPVIGLKLLSMGLKPGFDITVRRKTFNGQTFYISSRGKNIAVRKKEAKAIEIEY
jgi:Fe2+ transport system protein FeoA